MPDVKKVAILQSNYIPWKGYFDIIRAVDEFVIYDDVQFTKRDWRNRNLIKTPNGVKWLTIPVKVKGRYHQLISETEIEDKLWASKHWKIIRSNYEKCLFYANYEKVFEATYKEASDCRLLSDINILFIRFINSLLGIETKISLSADYFPEGVKSERIISICRNAGAQTYLTGPSGLDYLEIEKFRKEGIEVVVADYEGYPLYDQPFPPFLHNVSIVDLIFSTGEKAHSFLKKLI